MDYVMSDIHGEYDMFLEMLKKINFKNDDNLYICGDIFDRGAKPIELLEHIVANPNIHLILGNHEQMFLDYIDSNKTTASLWFRFGGLTTFNALVKRGELYEQMVYEYLKKLPHYMIVRERFILVHAGLFVSQNEACLEEIFMHNDEDEMLWSRSHIGFEKEHSFYKIIAGHICVGNIEHGRTTILHRNMNIYIDCGAHFKSDGGRLACLNLDTMEEFYV